MQVDSFEFLYQFLEIISEIVTEFEICPSYLNFCTIVATGFVPYCLLSCTVDSCHLDLAYLE